MTFVLSVVSFLGYAQEPASDLNLNSLSEQFLTHIKNNTSTNDIRSQLYGLTMEQLENSLVTDHQKLAFWINIYNAYIQVILTENPDLYKDRGSFFKKDQVPIAGRLVSFDKIEHGIIRRSQVSIGLGLVGKWFPDDFEKRLRVQNRNYHIHFALNCGAKDCPPVAIYKVARLEDQFDKGTEKFLKRTSTYNAVNKTVAVSPLFSWFRGDFGSSSGIVEILRKYKIIPAAADIDITYTEYDWTLDLGNWIEL
ncbi:MAG: DUF547 domain-containing protein [Maribacter sp.]|nr:DUF547 domain-containing protein [Maribacter sp.]